MFIGEYTHTLDPKNRISLPSKFRKDLGKSIIITRGLDNCLFVYSRKAWEHEAKERAKFAAGNSAGRALARHFLSGAMEADVDSAGRILVPDHLRSFAGLKNKAVVAGVAERIELWNETAWKKYIATTERNADQYAEALGNR